MAEPLDYRSPPENREPGFVFPLFAMVSIALACGSAAITRQFYRGVFDNNRYGGDWFLCGLTGIGLWLVGTVFAALELRSRHRVAAWVALAVSVAVAIYGFKTPLPKNVPLP